MAEHCPYRDRLLFRLSRIVYILEIGYIALVGLPMSLADTNVSYIGDVDGSPPWV